MPDTELCQNKATIAIGRHTEADVECGLELNHEERNHVASNPTRTTDGGEATIIFTWKV